MASNHVCIICKETEEKEPGLKLFIPERWETAKNAAARRFTLQNDQFFSASEEIRKIEQPEGKYYHSKCFSRFCATKRQPPGDNELSQPPSKVTRSTSGHPSTNVRGVLGQECLFCGKQRKRKSQKNEPLNQCLTEDGCISIISAAKRKCDTRILGLGEDLIAKEAKYHNSCRRNYIRQDEDEDVQTSIRKKHNEAFQTLLNFLDSELIKKKKPMLATAIFSLYKEEFLALGGTNDDINKYSVQSLMTKVKDHLEGIVIDKQAKKSGNVVFSSSMTSAEAFALLHESDDTAEKIRYAAMALRREIFAMPSSEIPSPTSVHTLKDKALNIPPLTLLFFRTLIGGMQSEPRSASSEDVIERKAVASASDAVFNCTRGAVCPWKHQSLGLGLGTLTGSKALLTILNRFGHCISYDEVKRLETEMAYTCSDSGCETPAGLYLHSNLATGNAD